MLLFTRKWANIPAEHIKIVDDPALARWRHYLLKALDMRPYLLSEPEEKILAEKSVTGISAWTRYFGEVFSAARYEVDGQMVPADVALKRSYSADRAVRKAAAESLTPGLTETLPTATYVFNT